MGYHRAGLDVVGVDIKPQPNYPFEFHQADALSYPLEGFDGFHASPPCQDYTTMNNRWGSDAPRLIAPIRERLRATELPYVIENVPGAKAWLLSPLELTGEMFGLAVHRPRLFESNQLFLAPPRPPRQKNAVAVYGKQDGRRLWTRTDGTELRVANLEMASAAMAIDWMTWDEIREAIPPAYTEWIGRQLLPSLRMVA
jgi:DNA (cytosine-5)-methyltransferase 1